MTPRLNDVPAGRERELAALLAASARFLTESPAPQAFLEWLANEGPELAPEMAAAATATDGAPEPMFRALALAIYNALPLPEHGFRPGRLRAPGRNEPCLCGSGRKYKHCCRSAVALPELEPADLLRHVLDALPVTRFPELRGVCRDLEAVADTALQWIAEGHLTRAAALLEPWFAGDESLDAAVEPIAQALLTCYAEQHRSHRQDWLAEQLLARGDRVLRATALRERSVARARRGELEAAWADFQAARTLAPSDPRLALTELTVLLLEGDLDKARERAGYWFDRLDRRAAAVDDWILDFAYDVERAPEVVRAELLGETNPRLIELARLLEAAPAPVAHFAAGECTASGSRLEPDARMAAAESAWRERYGAEKPAGAVLALDADDGTWIHAAEWLDFLAREPIAWQSFAVIDDLVLAVDLLARDETVERVRDDLVDRGLALLEVNGPALGGRTVDPEDEAGRSALRLLAQAVRRELDAARDGPPGDRFFELAERLLTLNPDDDYGVIEPLVHACLERGETERAIAVSGVHGTERGSVALYRVLALLRADREAEAAALLRERAPALRPAIAALLEAHPQQPLIDSPWTADDDMTVWAARRALWAQDGALEWLRAMCPEPRPEPAG